MTGIFPQETQKLLLEANTEPLNEVLETELSGELLELALCESSNNHLAVNLSDPTPDSPSYGLFQWKTESFYFYNQKYKIVPDLEKNEVLNVIMDREIQIRLTKKVLEEPEGWKNWMLCSRNIGLDKSL